MRGLIHTADVYRLTVSAGRQSYGAAPSTTWKCFLQPLGPGAQLAERFAQSTHRAIGQKTPVIDESDRLVILGDNYQVIGIQRWDRPGFAPDHQEVMLARAE